MRRDIKVLLAAVAVLVLLLWVMQFAQTGGVRTGMQQPAVHTLLPDALYCNTYCCVHRNAFGNYVVVRYKTPASGSAIINGSIPYASDVQTIPSNRTDSVTWGVQAIAEGADFAQLVGRLGIPTAVKDYSGHADIFEDPLGNGYMVHWSDETRSESVSVQYIPTEESPVPAEQTLWHYLCIGLYVVGLIAMGVWITSIVRKESAARYDDPFRPKVRTSQEQPEVPSPLPKRRLWSILLTGLVACACILFSLFARFDTRGLYPGMEMTTSKYQQVADALTTRNHILYENRFGQTVLVRYANISAKPTPSFSSSFATKNILLTFQWIDPLTTSRTLYTASTIEEGMSLSEVVQRLGKPDSTGLTGSSSSILFYYIDDYRLRVTFGEDDLVANVNLMELANGQLVKNPDFAMEISDVFFIVRPIVVILFTGFCVFLILPRIQRRPKHKRRASLEAELPEDTTFLNEPEPAEEDDFRPIF